MAWNRLLRFRFFGTGQKKSNSNRKSFQLYQKREREIFVMVRENRHHPKLKFYLF